MHLTEKEMIFLTSVSRGRAPFGLLYHVPEKSKRSQFVEDTIEELKMKKYLNEEGKLTKEGTDIIYLWERYRNCKKHIRINQCNIAVLPEEVLIVVVQTEDGYEMVCTNKETFMASILKYADFLCQEDKKRERGKWRNLEEAAFAEEVMKGDGYLLLFEYTAGKLESEKIYYWKEEEGFLFNRKSKRVRNLSPGVMRRQIYQALEEV